MTNIILLYFILLIYRVYCIQLQYNRDNNYLSKKWEECKQCNDNTCEDCVAEELFHGLKILSPIDTLNEIINNNKSIARFGNGDFDIIFGKREGFQKKNKRLSKRLKKILNSNEKGLIIGIHNCFNIDYAENYKRSSKKFWRKFVRNNKNKLIKLINYNYQYGSSNISRFYMDLKDKSNVEEYVKKLKQIWDKKNIILIEGEKTRFGVGNDLLDNSNSIKRIICPATNAYDLYDKILNETLKIKKDNLILIALGPTATVLAYDLHKNGYQAVDIGHVDIEYEWFKRKVKRKVIIENKFTNEIRKGRVNITDINDENYTKQIIIKILN